MRELERVSLLLGEEAIEALQSKCVLVIGCGGVGSYAIEALARSGIGKLIIVDKDVISISNLNRQLMTNYTNVGLSKTLEMKKRIETYSKCEVVCVEAFFDETCAYLLDGVDFVIDAIDTVTSKLFIAKECHKRKIKFVMSLGMGNRLDPSQLVYTSLDKTSYDPLAKAMRTICKKEKLNFKIPVIFSKEIPCKQNVVVDEKGKTRKDRIPPASMIFVPAAAGLLAASVCVRKLLA